MYFLSIIIIALSVLAVVAANILKSRHRRVVSVLGIVNILLAAGAYAYFAAKVSQNGGIELAPADRNTVTSVYFADALAAVLICGAMLLLAFKRQEDSSVSRSSERIVRTSGALILFGIIAIFSFVAISLAIALS
jgi:hypothetical protein